MPRTLKQWETYLVGTMPRVQLLSELGLNYEDMLEIANLIKLENQGRPNFHQTTHCLIENYPCTFVAFLAAFAAQNTEREFWDALARLLEVSGGDLNNAKWRNHFIDILKKNKKRTFEGISFLYVSNMRIHGGIPSYSLEDYFINMLMPAIDKPEYIELQDKELLDALFMRSSVQLSTDSTVLNFFEFSGDIGLEFLESSRHVAREYISKRQIPSDANLPAYVVQKLIAFLEYQEDEKRGVKRPRVLFDADEGLVLELPEQILSGTDVQGYEVRWQVYQGDNILSEVFLRIASRGRVSYSKAAHSILGSLIDSFQVSFSVATVSGEFRQLREWSIDVLSDDMPDLLVFRKEDGSLFHWIQALPAQDLILVYPQDINLHFEGNAHLRHELSLLATGWQHWKAELWSLHDAWSLNLFRGDGKIAEIQIQKQLELPRLIGEIFSPNLDPKPLYVGAPPILRIPLRPGINPEDELKRWQIEINSTWEAEPSLHQLLKLSKTSNSVTIEDAAIQLDLRGALGVDPKGTYALRVRGPLDTEVEFPFRVWPSLHIKDLPEFILPSENQNITFYVALPITAKLEVLAGSLGINLTGEDGRYAVELDETTSRVDFNLIWPQEDSFIHVPFSLPIPRLEWRFAMGEDSRLDWTDSPIRKPLDAFMQAGQIPTLHVRLPGIETIADQISLRLVDPECPNKISHQFAPEKSALGNDHIRFLLNASDTLNHFVDISIFEFQLMAPFREGTPEAVTLLTLTRDVDVSDVRIENTKESQFLVWEEPSPLRNRRVFIRSIWKEWEKPWNIRIPDNVRGKFDLLTAGYGLPQSCYQVYFYVASSWEKDIISVPDRSTYEVKTIAPEEQLTWLDTQIQKHPEQSFLNHFERACLYSSVGDIQMRNHEITNCYNNLDQAKPAALLAFHEWLGKYDPNTKRAVRMKMFHPEHLHYLFTAYKPKDEFRQKYLRFLVDGDNKPESIKPESALLLIQNEHEWPIVFHALRGLMLHSDERVLNIIANMVETGRLLDSDAIGLLRIKEEFSLSVLNATELSPVKLRLQSGLLRDKSELLSKLNNDKILSFINVEQDSQTINQYLGILIAREDARGLEFIMDRFKKGLILGNDVTEILGKNAIFSMRILLNTPENPAHSAQISELAQKYPLETGNIAVGMSVLTPAGWARIHAIEDTSGHDSQFVSIKEKRGKLHTTLYPNTSHSLEAIVDVENERMQILGAQIFYQCGICGFVAMTQKYIIHDHTHESHGGLGASFNPISPDLLIRGELKFSQTYPS